ncbi:MAG: DUF2782 domain-containing protein [Gammaproteobacteria bacterium]|nr:DUF2782 domain-containing protein [Gammaproteobacteria bacterium]
MNKLLMALCLLLVVQPAWSQSPEESAPEPPKLPPQVQSGEVLEPEVTITETRNEQIQQYSVNGKVYMVKVIPTAGPPYFLLDLDGDGELDVKSDNPGDNWIPQWVLFSW